MSFHGKRPEAASPSVIAGLKCAPETGPHAYAPTTTVRPNAKATPTKPTPSGLAASPYGNPDANSAVPTPPKTSSRVPRASATSLVAIFGSVVVSVMGGLLSSARE
ncbi:hypothetical protein GCM10022200_11170 [Microbacterium awajiense]|uniref:Uncharacterized protein n=1 Tax=Microbacterium awajiense TaxID=415214 RepID=A0ABP7AE68_9MICO